MYRMTFAEFFHRLFAASWLPGRGQNWQIVQTQTANTTIAQVMPFDGILLDLIVLIVVLLLIDWMLKTVLRRYV